MFKDKLKNDLDKLSPNEQTKEKILSKISQEKVKPLYPKIISAIAACLAIVLAIGIFANNDKIDDKISYPATVSNKKSQKNYDEIYKIINNAPKHIKEKNAKYSSSYYDFMGSSAKSVGSSKDFSKTNTVVENIDEDDLLKTDGDYIYQVDESFINIYKANGKNTKKIETLDLSKYNNYNEIDGIYLYKNKLVVLFSDCKNLPYTSCKCNYCKKENEQECTNILVYNIKNPKNVELETKFIQSGYFSTSRIVGNTLYLSSSFTPDIYGEKKIEKKEKSRYLPIFYDGKKYSYQNSGCIRLSDSFERTTYSIIASYNLDNNSKIDDKSFFGDAKLNCVSNDNAYFTEVKYKYVHKHKEYTNKTKITKFSIKNGIIKFVASEKIDGRILNEFSMDEKDGYLRLVTTQEKGKTFNHLFVLDDKLKIVGSVKNLAKNEKIYSARFLGDYAYFVTYRNTDPLFCADLSNPKKPKIVSELKMPGFSDYLHPFGKDKLFGLGETDDESVKIAMYDISNKENLKEIVTKKLDADYSDVSYNHHTILVDKRKNLIAFPCDVWEFEDEDEDVSYYYIFKFENNEFKIKTKIKLDSYYGFRGLYIDDYFFISDNGHLKIVSLNSFEKIKEVK